MTESVTMLRPHLRHECFAVVRCGDSWELCLLIGNVPVRREPIAPSFAHTLLESVGRDAYDAAAGLPQDAYSWRDGSVRARHGESDAPDKAQLAERQP